MKRTAIVLLILAVVTLLMGCSADDIMNSGKTLQKLQGVNASYAAGNILKEAETTSSKLVDLLQEETFVLPTSVPLDTPISDDPNVKALQDFLENCAAAVIAAKETGANDADLRAILSIEYEDNEDAWDEYGNYINSRGKFTFLDIFGFEVVLAYKYKDEGNADALANYGISFLSSSAFGDLISGAGTGNMPDSVKELVNLLRENTFGLMKTHLKDDHMMTNGDFIITAILTDTLITLRDLTVLNPDFRFDAQALERPEFGKIMSYISVIEYISGVDFNMFQRLAEIF